MRKLILIFISVLLCVVLYQQRILKQNNIEMSPQEFFDGVTGAARQGALDARDAIFDKADSIMQKRSHKKQADQALQET